MEQSEKLIGRLDSLDYRLSSIQESISSISMPDFVEGKSDHSLFPDFIQDLFMYQDFDWSSVSAKVVTSDKFGAAVLIYKGNVFKRKIAYHLEFNSSSSHDLEIYYESCHDYRKERLITFKDLKFGLIDPIEISKLSLDVVLQVSKNFPPVERLKIEIAKVEAGIEKAEKEYDLSQAAELKYGTLKRLEEQLKALEDQQNQGRHKKK